jgi:hypothetical protein
LPSGAQFLDELCLFGDDARCPHDTTQGDIALENRIDHGALPLGVRGRIALFPNRADQVDYGDVVNPGNPT